MMPQSNYVKLNQEEFPASDFLNVTMCARYQCSIFSKVQ